MDRARWVLAVVLVLAVPLAGMRADASGEAAAEGGVQVQRLAGGSRAETAAALSAATYPSTRDVVLIARADDFADALAASAYAGAVGAPLLLSNRDGVPSATMREVARLSAGRAVILGGLSAIGLRAEGELRAAGLQVERVAGRTRFATAAELARRIGRDEVGTVAGRRTAFLANAGGFPDALAAGPLAHRRVLPVLLTSSEELAEETAAAIRDLAIEHVIVLGGHAAVSARVEDALGVPTTRLHGPDRTATASRVAGYAVTHLGFSPTEIVLARGDAFPDALAAAAYGGTRHAALLLTQSPTRLGRATRDHLLGAAGATRLLTGLGGVAALAPGTLEDARRAARGITYTFPVQPAAAASYGRAHHDYPATDIFAACGTAVVSPTVGRVDEVSTVDRWDPAVNEGSTRGGLSVSIVGDDGVRYYGSHLATIEPAIRPGARVAAGQRLGTVGRTGSARPTPCHLHFGLSPPCATGDWEVRRGVIAPWPYLDAWQAGDHRSPVAEVAAWAAANPQRCPGA